MRAVEQLTGTASPATDVLERLAAQVDLVVQLGTEHGPRWGTDFGLARLKGEFGQLQSTSQTGDVTELDLGVFRRLVDQLDGDFIAARERRRAAQSIAYDEERRRRNADPASRSPKASSRT